MSDYKMPSLGADMKDAILIEWYVKPGDTVKRGDIIADLETDKGDIDVEVYEDGVIEKLIAQPGEKLPIGTVLATIKSVGDESTIGKEEKELPKPEAIPVGLIKPAPKRIKVSPLAKRMAESMMVDLTNVKGTGEGGVIHKIDIENYARTSATENQQQSLEAPLVSLEEKEPSAHRMRRAIASAMSKSNREIPHYYLETDVDMSQSFDWLAKENKMRSVKERMLPIAIQIKAMAKALADVPELNAYWQNDQIQIQESVNIGLAISLRQGGLLVPAINNADLKSLDEIMEDVLDITQRTRSGKIKTSDLISPTITLTNLGDRGIQTVYGVIYPPQVAIVGMGKITDRPWVEQKMLGIRPILTVTLAGDHRATDGHLGARFLDLINDYLQKPETL